MTTSATMPKRLIDMHNHLWQDDTSGSRLIEAMDATGVETALIMGTPGRSNENVLAAVAKYPERFTGGAFLDLREGQQAIDQLHHYHAEGMRVVKLFPNFGYYPDDDEFRQFFDVVAALGMAVLSHCGWLSPAQGVTASYYARPGRFEKLIRAYTDTPFILAHMGGIDGFCEAIMLTTRAPNAYVDLAPGQGLWVVEFAGKMAGSIPPEKIMWGMDGYYDPAIIARYQAALEASGFAEHLEKIFRTNALGILQRIGAIKPAG